MVFRVPTRYEEFVLQVTVHTARPEKIRIVLKDEKLKNTVLTDRWKTVNGNCTFFIRVPVSAEFAILNIFNERIGNVAKDNDRTFSIDPQKDIKKIPLDKKMDLVDFANPDIREYVNFCTRFCFNAGDARYLPSGTYQSNNGRFIIEYLPTIISSETGQVLNTPARIDKKTGRIQASQSKLIPMSVPGRMAIMLHEFSHCYINDDMNNEIEADLNGLLIYLGLGYPRIEAHEVFTKTFVGAPSDLNKKRYDILTKFINDFETNKFYI